MRKGLVIILGNFIFKIMGKYLRVLSDSDMIRFVF